MSPRMVDLPGLYCHLKVIHVIGSQKYMILGITVFER
jgi:hypothetical protein